MHALLRTLISLGATVALVPAVTAQVFDPLRPDLSAGTEGSIKIFHIGPYTIPAGRVVGGQTVPGEYEQIVPAANPGNVWMTGFDSKIVDTNKVPLDPAQFYLHHAVLVKVGTFDLTCTFVPGERFAASGAERIPVSLPPGHGYRINGNETMVCILHMQNFSLQPKNVYWQYSMTTVPGTISPPLVAVRPWWLDVVNCSSSYVVPTGTGQHLRSGNFTASQRTTIMTMGPHLHCGGLTLELFNLSTNQRIWLFTNQNPCPVRMSAVIPSPSIVLPAGTQVQLRATYQQSPTTALDAMGIMLGYVVLG